MFHNYCEAFRQQKLASTDNAQKVLCIVKFETTSVKICWNISDYVYNTDVRTIYQGLKIDHDPTGGRFKRYVDLLKNINF